MYRRQLAFLVIVNAIVSLVIVLGVVWAFEARRPDPEELAAINTPRPEAVLAVPVGQPTPPPGGLPAPTTVITTAPPPSDSEVVTPDVAAAEAPEEIYVVQPGDTLLVIATRYNITIDDILRANNLTDPNFVFAGQRLIIPVQGGAVNVTPGAGVAGGEAPSPNIQIASISNPGDLAAEQVLLVNESDTAVSLQGWQLEREGGPAYTFSSDVPLFPGGSVRVHSGSGTNTSIDFFWGLTEPLWQSGVTARLLNAEGAAVNTSTVP